MRLCRFTIWRRIFKQQDGQLSSVCFGGAVQCTEESRAGWLLFYARRVRADKTCDSSRAIQRETCAKVRTECGAHSSDTGRKSRVEIGRASPRTAGRKEDNADGRGRSRCVNSYSALYSSRDAAAGRVHFFYSRPTSDWGVHCGWRRLYLAWHARRSRKRRWPAACCSRIEAHCRRVGSRRGELALRLPVHGERLDAQTNCCDSS